MDGRRPQPDQNRLFLPRHIFCISTMAAHHASNLSRILSISGHGTSTCQFKSDAQHGPLVCCVNRREKSEQFIRPHWILLLPPRPLATRPIPNIPVARSTQRPVVSGHRQDVPRTSLRNDRCYHTEAMRSEHSSTTHCRRSVRHAHQKMPH